MAKRKRGRNKAVARTMERMATDFGAFYPLGFAVAAFHVECTAPCAVAGDGARA